MNIGLLAHNSKKSLMEDFCLAYKRILEKHELYATGTTGRRIEEVTKLHVHKFLPGSIGGEKQFVEMIARNEMDMVIFFYNPLLNSPKEPSLRSLAKRFVVCFPDHRQPGQKPFRRMEVMQRLYWMQTEHTLWNLQGNARR